MTNVPRDEEVFVANEGERLILDRLEEIQADVAATRRIAEKGRNNLRAVGLFLLLLFVLGILTNVVTYLRAT